MARPWQGQGARGRRWWVSLVLAGVGLLVLGYGLLDHYQTAVIAGVVLILFFGAMAAGARKMNVSSPLVSADTEFDAPEPPPPGRKIYLPTRRSKRKR